MSYQAIAMMAHDEGLSRRIRACLATEGRPFFGRGDPAMWRLCASPGWADAYAYALANGIADAGWNGTVITDGMILSAVQLLFSNQQQGEA